MRSKSRAVSGTVSALVIVIIVVAALAGYLLYGSGPAQVLSTTTTVASTSVPVVPLRIFAAASFHPALTALQSSYEHNYSVSLVYNFASSGALETQISQGSPADVFLDADVSNNVKLQNAGLLGNGNTYVTLIHNNIALFVPANNPKNITGLSDLLRPGVRVAIGAPASVPAGAYTVQVWANVQAKWGNGSSPDFKSAAYANFSKAIMAHVVTQTTDVESAITEVITGAADVAFGYGSDGVANAAQLLQIGVPSDVNVQATYTVSLIAGSQYPTQATAFIDYLLSPQGQAFLQRWGFTPLAGGA